MSKGVVGNLYTLHQRISLQGYTTKTSKRAFNYLLYKQFFGTSRNTVLTPFIFSTHTNTDKLYQYLWHFMCLICEPCWHQVNADRQLKNQTFLVPRTPTRSIFAAWKPLLMSRRSWVVVINFKTPILRLKPEVQILGSSKTIFDIHKYKFFVWNHVSFVRKKQNFTQTFER